jgi:steroid delta-isomerase-like uncharacterized protein
MARSTPETEQVLKDYEDVWYGDFSKLDVVSETVSVHGPDVPDGAVHGRDAFESYVREFRTAFPDFHVAVEERLAREPIVMIEWTATGTQEGEFLGNPPTDREFEITGVSKILIEDGRVREERLYYDFREMLEQLGLQEG